MSWFKLAAHNSRRTELAKRTCFLFVAAAISGAFGGLIVSVYYTIFASPSNLLSGFWIARYEWDTRIIWLAMASLQSALLSSHLLALGFTSSKVCIKNPVAAVNMNTLSIGTITVAIGLCVPFLLPDNFESARYLNEDQKQIMRSESPSSR